MIKLNSVKHRWYQNNPKTQICFRFLLKYDPRLIRLSPKVMCVTLRKKSLHFRLSDKNQRGAECDDLSNNTSSVPATPGRANFNLMSCFKKHKTNKQEALERQNGAWNLLRHFECDFYINPLSCPWREDGIKRDNYRRGIRGTLKGNMQDDTLMEYTYHGYSK